MMKKAYIRHKGRIVVNSTTFNVSKCTSYTNDNAVVTLINEDNSEYKLGFPCKLPIVLQ